MTSRPDRPEDLPRLMRERKQIWAEIETQARRTAELTARIQRILDRQAGTEARRQARDA